MCPGGTVTTGQYVVFKYRLPSSNAGKVTVYEMFTSTKNAGAVGEDCYSFGSALINDGKWHVIVVDLASWGKTSYAPAADGTYKANYVRFDPFYKNPVGVFFEYAFFGMNDNLEEIYDLVSDMQAIQYVSFVNSKVSV